MSTALFLAVQKSAEKSSILKETFNMFSFISFEPLPIDIIVTYIQQLDQNCGKEDIYLEIKHCSLFLFEENEDQVDVRIHRVVHEAITLLSENKRTELGKSSEPAVPNNRARVGFPSGVQNVVQALYCFKARDDMKKIIPHLKAFDRKVKGRFATQRPWYSLTSYFTKHEIYEFFSFFAQCLFEYCEFELALELQNINLQLYEYCKNDLTLACILSEICILHIVLGKFDKAKEHGHRALEIRKKALGPSNADVGASYNYLGIVYQDMGELEQAKDYHLQALEIRVKVLGPTHVLVGASYNNLGIVYKYMGQLEQAKDYHQRALEIKTKAFSSNHVNVATSYNNLAAVYQDMGELEQAKDYHQRTLEIKTKALGPKHVNVATSYNNLAAVYQDMGELEQAKDYHQRALEIRVKALGPTHVHVGHSYNNLGNVYQKMGNLEQAMDYHQRALEIRVKASGRSNLDPKVGKLEKAEDYRQRATEIETGCKQKNKCVIN